MNQEARIKNKGKNTKIFNFKGFSLISLLRWDRRSCKAGFSLIELMVVISIIGVVAAVSAGSISTIQQNSRNAQRSADLNTLRLALQQFYADQQHYPDTMVLTGGAALTSCTGVIGTCPVAPATLKTYLNSTPVDPVKGTTTSYYYCAKKSATVADCSTIAGSCHFYNVCATLENPGTTSTCGCIPPVGNTFVDPL